jgi:hypothetical protein
VTVTAVDRAALAQDMSPPWAEFAKQYPDVEVIVDAVQATKACAREQRRDTACRTCSTRCCAPPTPCAGSEAGAVLVLAIDVVVVFCSIVWRYFLHEPPGWAEKMARALLLLVFLGAAHTAAARCDAQVHRVIGSFPDTRQTCIGIPSKSRRPMRFERPPGGDVQPRRGSQHRRSLDVRGLRRSTL